MRLSFVLSVRLGVCVCVRVCVCEGQRWLVFTPCIALEWKHCRPTAAGPGRRSRASMGLHRPLGRFASLSPSIDCCCCWLPYGRNCPLTATGHRRVTVHELSVLLLLLVLSALVAVLCRAVLLCGCCSLISHFTSDTSPTVAPLATTQQTLLPSRITTPERHPFRRLDPHLPSHHLTQLT